MRLLNRKDPFTVLSGKIAQGMYGNARYLQKQESGEPLLFNCGGYCLEDLAGDDADVAEEDAIEAGIQARMADSQELDDDAAVKKEEAAAKRRAKYAEKKKATMAAQAVEQKKNETAEAATGGMQGSA